MKKVMVLVAVAALVPALALAKRTAKEVSGKINLNEATEAQLELLPGIGPKVAKEIVEYRAQKPFEKAGDIRNVKGVGKSTYAKIKDHIAVSGATTLASEGSKSSAQEKPKTNASHRRTELEEMEE